MIKTLSYDEHRLLLDFATTYKGHMAGNPKSLICRHA